VQQAHRVFPATALLQRVIRASAQALALLLAAPAFAVSIPGGDPIGSGSTGCIANAGGSLQATPSTIDRNVSLDRQVTLAWSVSLPAGCAATISISPASGGLLRSGSMQVTVSHAQTFSLNVRVGNRTITVASAPVAVLGDPGIISVSSGRLLLPVDVAAFDAKWMQPFDRAQGAGGAQVSMFFRADAAVWGIGELMGSLVRMYDLTHDRRYLDYLRDLCEVVLRMRDDNYPGNPDPRCEGCEPMPVDLFRGRNEPAWGGRSVNSGGLYRVDEVTSSVYGYPVAAFARIVAEDPALQADYGAHAIRYANAMLQTAWVFIPQISYRPAGPFFEAYLTQLDIYRTKPTADDCTGAYYAALSKAQAAPDFDASVQARLQQMLDNCNNLRRVANSPMSYNENQAFLMMLIELWRALDSGFYRQSAAPSKDAEPTRELVPLIVSRHQRYFANHLATLTDDARGPRFSWHHADDVPPGVTHDAEDTSHGALDMRYVEVLGRSFDRLNAVASASGEPIAFDSSYLTRFANTFIEKIATGTNFAEGVDGGVANPPDHRNGSCEGWVNLGWVNPTVFDACREMSLRVIGGSQPYLGIGAHSSMLANKVNAVGPSVPPRLIGPAR
jgi:hypothetical protein